MFINNFNDFQNPDSESILEYGQYLYKNEQRTSENKKFKLKLQNNGNLALYHHRILIWQNHMVFFKYHDVRVRINEKGHLVQEALNIFEKTQTPSGNYRENEWITVWSSASINHNVTIGIPNINNKVYKLIVSDSGSLNLYDSVGALIWCTSKNCNHRSGYKFPEVYLLPTVFITPKDSDRHNSIDARVEFLDSNSLMSIDANCDSSLMSNQALVSNNQRFKLILEDSGNLVIKDSYRTMWESVSGFVPHAVGPFKLILSPSGMLIVISSNDYIVWNSWVSISLNNATKPFTMTILDEGRLVITDMLGREVWESWPVRDMSFGLTFFRPVEYRYVPCHGNGLQSKKELTTYSNNMLLNSDKLISKNGIWDLRIKNEKLVIYKLNVENKIVIDYSTMELNNTKIDRLTLGTRGEWILWSKKNEKLYQSEMRDHVDESTFQMVLDDKNGTIKILNKFNENIQFRNNNDIETNNIRTDSSISNKKGKWNVINKKKL
jgi:hypothetical protein